MEDQGQRKPDVNLCESLAQADSLAAHERCKGKWVTRLTVWGQDPHVVLVFEVEPLGLELGRFSPLSGVMVHRIEGNLVPPTFLQHHLLFRRIPDPGVFSHGLHDTGGRWCLNPQRLVVALLKVVKLHDSVIIEIIEYRALGSRLLDGWENLLHQLGLYILMLSQVIDQVSSRGLNGLHSREEESDDLVNNQIIVPLKEIDSR